MMKTIAFINELSKKAGIVSAGILAIKQYSADLKQTDPSLLNYVVTDGESVIATR